MSNECKLAQLGANERDAPDAINLDVSGTLGPDYLGQETTNVRGHPNNRPGVRSRIPEQDRGENVECDQRINRMDTGEELPVLLESDMSTDPIEGVQGTYSEIIEGECSRCGYDRLVQSVVTLTGDRTIKCNACGYDQRGRMPTTDEEHVNAEREAGRKLGELLNRDVYDMEPDTGYGPYVSLIGDKRVYRIRKDDVAELFMLVYDDLEDLVDVLAENLDSTANTMFTQVWKDREWRRPLEADNEKE